MPPVQVHIDDPIQTPKKADGVTPQTSDSPAAPAVAYATTTHEQAAQYPAARPGAAAVPAPTPYASQPPSQPQPTRTTPAADYGLPSPPQPGAVPVPPIQPAPMTAGSALPPPPRPGEAAQRNAPVTTMPAQMGVPPPQQNYTPSRGTSAYSPAERGAPTTLNFGAAPSPQQLHAGAHPPGYQQNVNAQVMDSAARASLGAQERSQSFGGNFGAGGSDGAGDAAGNVWNAVKGWAAAAGNTLAETEKEVWRRVNRE